MVDGGVVARQQLDEFKESLVKASQLMEDAMRHSD